MKRMKHLVALLILGLIPGCMSATYSDAQGNRLEISKFCWESKIGHLEATNGTGTRIVIDNYDSESQAVQLAEQAVKVAAAAVAAAPK